MQREPRFTFTRHAWGALFVFSFVFNVELARPEGLSLSLIALVIGFFALLFTGRLPEPLRGQRTLLAFALAVPALYIATFQTALRETDANTLAQLYLKTLVFVVLSTSVFHGLFLRGCTAKRSVDFLLKSVTWAFVLQAGFVMLSFVNPAFRDAIDAVLTAKGNLTGLEGFRVKGLANSGGANLSMAMSLAAIMGAYVALNGGRWLYAAAVLVIMAASTFVGRSGLVGFGVAAVAFCLYVFVTGRVSRTRVAGVLAGCVALGLVTAAATSNLDDDILLWWNWFAGQAGDSVADVWDMYAHDFSVKDALIGKGYFETQTNGNDRSDVGYLKTIFSVGFPAAILFYAGLMLVYSHGARAFVALSGQKAIARLFTVLLIALVFFFESKEAMAYQNFTGRLMLFAFTLFAGIHAATRHRRADPLPATPIATHS